eukprot:TRINITY_DN18556_c0_g1_i2.p1 TRINITY_DN18556_c0_g1~~TRINITY_DN18556_c0_g1_i2.p1  ORF type:complete len:362 (-),score=46.94 TRINITY_DN18556_c0_g1_i2:242-1291(-)
MVNDPSASLMKGGPPHYGKDTLIFLDVDGVLSVGVVDPGKAAYCFSEKNLDKAMALPEHDPLHVRFADVYCRALDHGEDCTLEKYIIKDEGKLSDILVRRFAKLMQLASGNRNLTVVLSSVWRNPDHAGLTARLEQKLSESLGRPFSFQDRTSLGSDTDAASRLRRIGEYVAEHSTKSGQSSADSLRVLVLDDFHVTPLMGWECDNYKINSAGDIEEYLRNCAAFPNNVSVKMIHTYDEWQSEEGLQVQVSTGLTKQHFCEASVFVASRPCRWCRERHAQNLSLFQSGCFSAARSLCLGTRQTRFMSAGSADAFNSSRKDSPSEVPSPPSKIIHYWGLLKNISSRESNA